MACEKVTITGFLFLTAVQTIAVFVLQIWSVMVNVLLETILRKNNCYLTVKSRYFSNCMNRNISGRQCSHIVLLDLTGNTSEWPAILFFLIFDRFRSNLGSR